MKKIYICPKKIAAFLKLEIRKNDPFDDFKTITKNELIDRVLGSCKSNALFTIIDNFKYPYSYAKKITTYLPFVDINENYSEHKKLNRLVNEKRYLIEHNLYENDEYVDQFFKDKEVIVLGYSKNDKELNTAFSKLRIVPNYKEFSCSNRALEVTTFDTVSDEVNIVLNEIAKLLDIGVSLDDILLFIKDENYYRQLEKYSKNIGFNINLPNTNKYLYTSLGSYIVNELQTSNKNLIQILNEVEGESNFKEIKEIIGESGVLNNTSLSNKDLASILNDVLGNHSLPCVQFDHAVNIISSPIYIEKKHIFVLGFNLGHFPTISSDNEYLTDIHKNLLKMNTSYDKNQIEYEILINFLKSNNIFHISFAEKSFDGKYFISPLSKDLQMKINKGTLNGEIYSDIIARHFFGVHSDIKNLYKKETSIYKGLSKDFNPEYGTYSSSYTVSKVYNENSVLNLSYSKTKTYFECPFRYYLDNIIVVEPFEGSVNSKIGNVAHKVFEKCFDKNFDFDKTFANSIEEQEFNCEEKVYIEGLKEQIKIACDAILGHVKKMSFPQIEVEKSLKYPLDSKTNLIGKIDKCIVIKDHLYLVDYKTGSEDFKPSEVELGKSMQLPTYILLAHSPLSPFKDLEVKGIYIQHVLNTAQSYSLDDDELIPKYLKLSGQSINSIETIREFDDTFVSGTAASYIGGLKITKAGVLDAKSKVAGSDEFEKYEEFAKNFYLEQANNIRKNKFEIKQSDDGCKYCPYRDICFSHFADGNDVKNDEVEDEEDE